MVVETERLVAETSSLPESGGGGGTFFVDSKENPLNWQQFLSLEW